MPVNEELVEDGNVEEGYVQVSDPESGSATPTPQGELSNDVQKIPASKKSGFLEDYYNAASVHPIAPTPNSQEFTTSTEETNTDANEIPEMPANLEDFLNGMSDTITNGASTVSKTLATGWHDFIGGLEILTQEFEDFNIQQALVDTQNAISSFTVALALEKVEDRIDSDTPEHQAAQAVIDLCKMTELNQAEIQMELAMTNFKIAATEEVVKDMAKRLGGLNSGIKGDNGLRAYQLSLKEYNKSQGAEAAPQASASSAGNSNPTNLKRSNILG